MCVCVYVSVCHTARDWVFEFGVKYYVPEPVILQEEITRFRFVIMPRPLGRGIK